MFVEDNIRTYTAIDIVNKKIIYKKQSIYSDVKTNFL